MNLVILVSIANLLLLVTTLLLVTLLILVLLGPKNAYTESIDTSIDTMSIGFNVQCVNSKSSTCVKSKSLNSGTSGEYSNFG